MNAATITRAQDKSLFSALRTFSEQLFAAQGGWLVSRQARAARTPQVVAERVATRKDRADLFALAAHADKHSPNLAAELRWLANR